MNENQPLCFNLRSDLVVKRIFWCFLGVELFIVFLDVFVSYFEWSSVSSIRRMVNITREDSLSNWFSSLQVITVGFVLWIIAFAVRKQAEGNHFKRRFYCWSVIGAFFIYMGIDDAIKFHERMGTAFKVTFFESNEKPGTGIVGFIYEIFPSYTWQLVFGPFFVSMGIFILWFLWKELSSKKLWYWFLAGISLYAIAVGLDFVEGLDGELYEEIGIASFFSTNNYCIRHMSKTLEEFLEMFGTTIILTVFLRNLFRQSREWKINIS